MSFQTTSRGYRGVHRDPAIVLLLSIVTCGIYYLIWMASVSQELQDYLQETDTSPAMEVVITVVTCGLYSIYWDYKTAKKIARMQEMAGLPSTDNSTLYLILNIVGVGMVNALMEQQHLNEIWKRS